MGDTMTPELTPHRYPCARCGMIRRLSLSDQLCWIPEPDDSRKDNSCYRAVFRARQDDRTQDIIRLKVQRGAA